MGVAEEVIGAVKKEEVRTNGFRFNDLENDDGKAFGQIIDC